MAPKSRTTAKPKKRNFHQEHVLNRWMPGFFKGGRLGALKLRLGDDRHLLFMEEGGIAIS